MQYLADVEYQGVAPSVQFVGLKVLDGNGGGKTSDVIRAIEFAIANKRTFGIDIINLSLGHPIFEPAATDPLVQAVEKATQGRHHRRRVGRQPRRRRRTAISASPASLARQRAVGDHRWRVDHKNTVTRDDDRMAPYSSNGPTWYDGLVKPDVVAPGHMLASEAAPRSALFKTYPTLHTKGQSGKDFMNAVGHQHVGRRRHRRRRGARSRPPAAR